MLASAFRDFESDPFFDFGNSPFSRHPFFRDDPANYFQRHRQPLARDDDDQSRRRRLALEAAKPDDDDGGARRREDDHGSGSTALVRRDDRRRDEEQRQLERYDRHRPRGRDAGDLMAFPPMFGGGLGAMEQHFNQMFDGMHRMMANMGDQMRQMEAAAAREDFNGHLYSHSSVYSRGFDDDDDNDKAAGGGGGGGRQPRVYQAVSETMAGPGGVRETRRAMRDSRTRDERMAVGRHIGPRGHVVERRRNTGTGEQREDHNYDGIGEAEGEAFDREWHSRATALAGGRGGGEGGANRGSRALRDHRRSGKDAAAAASERPAITDGRRKP